jgi:hypothetical protein
MHAASVCRTQKEDHEQGVDQQDIFYRIVLFLAALTLCLFRRLLGLDDVLYRPVMGKGGDTGTTAGVRSQGRGRLPQRLLALAELSYRDA